MKKVLSLILAFAMCLTLCACGKSEEVKAVEEQIASIGKITIDSTETINAARDAYNALNAEDKEKVENVNVLHDATYESLVIRCSEMNKQSSILSSGVIQVWEEFGGQDFWKWFDDVLLFKDENTLQELKDYYATTEEPDNWNLSVWCAGYALDKAAFSDKDGVAKLPETDEEVAYAVALATPIGRAYNVLPGMDDSIQKDVAQFIKDYKEQYSDECNVLREWSLESSSFADFALEPSGNLADYKSKLEEYNTMMSRFQKEAEMLK